MKITHIITGLSIGGAEMMLYKLLSAMDHKNFTNEVISLTDIDAIGKKIQALGVPVRALGMRRGIPNPLMVLKLAHWLRRSKPEVIQTWMYHADLIGGLAAKIAGKIPVVWGIHHSNLVPGHNKRTTIWTAKLCARLSGWLPNKIVCVSDGARKAHEAIGYESEKMIVVPNGIDTAVFKPNLSNRTSVRKELGLTKDTLLICLVARFDPQKDHHNFIKAAEKFCINHKDTHFLLCGNEINWYNKKLVSWIDNAGLRPCFHLLGLRDDIPRLTSALDIASSSSFGESFALTLGEAMSCGIPCVATDIEGPVDLLGDYGWVVPIGDADALCRVWQEILYIPKEMMVERLRQARERILNHFSLQSMVEGYQTLYEGLNKDL